MIRRLKILFIIADGAHARLVARKADNGDFTVVETMDGGDRLRAKRRDVHAQSAGRSFESSSPSRHAVGKEDPYAEVKSAFAVDVADHAVQVAAQGDFQGVAVIAPAKLLAVLRDRVAQKTRLIGALAHDLVKTPEHELGRWLEPMERAADWSNGAA